MMIMTTTTTTTTTNDNNDINNNNAWKYVEGELNYSTEQSRSLHEYWFSPREEQLSKSRTRNLHTSLSKRVNFSTPSHIHSFPLLTALPLSFMFSSSMSVILNISCALLARTWQTQSRKRASIFMHNIYVSFLLEVFQVSALLYPRFAFFPLFRLSGILLRPSRP